MIFSVWADIFREGVDSCSSSVIEVDASIDDNFLTSVSDNVLTTSSGTCFHFRLLHESTELSPEAPSRRQRGRIRARRITPIRTSRCL